MFSDTATRVEAHTQPEINRRIDQKTQDRINFYRDQPSEAITQRLRELDEEWDTERLLQTNFAIFSSLGAALTARVHKRWAWAGTRRTHVHGAARAAGLVPAAGGIAPTGRPYSAGN